MPTKNDKIPRLEEDIEFLRKKLINKIEILKEIREFKLKIGNVVIHKEYKNCLVLDIQVAKERFGVEEQKKRKGVWILISSANLQNNLHSYNTLWIPSSEVAPYTEAAKVLYGE